MNKNQLEELQKFYKKFLNEGCLEDFYFFLETMQCLKKENSNLKLVFEKAKKISGSPLFNSEEFEEFEKIFSSEPIEIINFIFAWVQTKNIEILCNERILPKDVNHLLSIYHDKYLTFSLIGMSKFNSNKINKYYLDNFF